VGTTPFRTLDVRLFYTTVNQRYRGHDWLAVSPEYDRFCCGIHLAFFAGKSALPQPRVFVLLDQFSDDLFAGPPLLFRGCAPQTCFAFSGSACLVRLDFAFF